MVNYHVYLMMIRCKLLACIVNCLQQKLQHLKCTKVDKTENQNPGYMYIMMSTAPSVLYLIFSMLDICNKMIFNI